MAENLQGLLEKINREGVEKAQAQAATIVQGAKDQAAEIVRKAREEAEQSVKAAEKAAADYAARAQETLRQAARDTVLSVENAVTKQLTGLLARDVDAALAEPAQLAALIRKAIAGVTGPAEVAVPAKLAAALQAQLAALGSVKVILDETMDAGFSVRMEGGRVEHTFTGEAIAAELAKRLRPDLAKLVKNER